MKQQRGGFHCPVISVHNDTPTLPLRRWTCSREPSAAIGQAAIQVQDWFYVVFAGFLACRIVIDMNSLSLEVLAYKSTECN